MKRKQASKALNSFGLATTPESKKESLTRDRSSSGDSTMQSSAEYKIFKTGQQASSWTKKMHQRWHASNRSLPINDRTDIHEESLRPRPLHQPHPEYTQSSYWRIREFEAKFPKSDYTVNALKQSLLYGGTMMDPTDRLYAMQRICYLHEKKDYKPESLFVAASIFDFYVAAVGIENFPRKQVIVLVTISVLMSAKLE